MKFAMPTPNTEPDTDMEVDSNISMNVESNSDNVSDIIIMDTSDANMESFSSLPIDFESSNSSIETTESVEESLPIESNLPVFTDVAEETVYETEELFEDAIKFEDKPEKECLESFTADQQSENSLSDLLIESTGSDSGTILDVSDMNHKLNVENSAESESLVNNDGSEDISSISIAGDVNRSHLVTSSISTPSTSEISNLITISKNTNLASNVLEKVALNNIDSDNNSVSVGVVPTSISNTTFAGISNVIQVNSIGTSKNISNLKPFTIQNTRKLLPINIAPANTVKRPAGISIGQPASNFFTKVIVGQGKGGQPIVFANAPKPKSICVVPTTSNSSSSATPITAALAKQMGIQLQPIKPTTTKQLNKKFVFSSIPSGTQVLKKIQPVSKSNTPTKILPAPLVSKSSVPGQPAKIIVTQDYVMKGGTLIPKQPGGQVITISNLSPTPVVSNNASPKKQVQYIKLLNNVGSTNVPTITTTKGKIAAVTANATINKIDKDTPVIVASSSISSGTLNIKGTNSVQTSKSGITVVPIAPAVKPTSGQRLILPAVSKAKVENSQSLLNETKQLKTASNIVVVSNDVLEKFKGEIPTNAVKPKDDIRTKDHSKSSHESQENVPNVPDFRAATKSPTKNNVPTLPESGNGLRSRKPCNCTRSQCLKLYCECFANGEFCNNCNCVSCHNNMSHEENRQHAIRSCLDRNPQAFRPKIGKCLVGLSDRRHTKGCHCKRSGCLKNYCECYEAQIPCSENCKCMGCKNIDEMLFATTYPTASNALEKSDSELEFQTFSKNKLTAEINDAVGQSGSSNPRYYNRKARTNPRHAFSFIKDQVVEATCQCLLAQADEVKRRNINVEDGQKYILEEFGRCLIQIIECAPNKYAQS